MRAILLAAGRGSRLKNLTDDQPKCLVHVQGRPLLMHQKEALHAGGVEQIALVRGYKRERFVWEDLTYFDNERWSETNMVVSLQQSASWLSAAPCIVSYTDILYPETIVRDLMAAAGDIVVAYDPNWLALWSERFEDPLSDAETFRLSPDGCITEIGKRPASLDEVNGQYMGLLKLTPQGWAAIANHLAALPQQEVDRLDMTTLLSRLIESQIPVRGMSIGNTRWFEVDHGSDLEVAERYFANQSAAK